MGRRERRTGVNPFRVFITPDAWKEIKTLPGNVRQRVRKAITALADNQRPPKSKALDVTGLQSEVRRLRLDRWRIVYALTEVDRAVDVLAVRKRPPYDYGDLEALLEEYSAEEADDA
jgi:mRNA interferase RelE/StbE